MKYLTFFRHAKSSWKYDVSDHERPLKPRGFKDACLVSEQLNNENFTVDLIVSSSAKRALTTCHIFMDELKLTNTDTMKITNELYDFSGSQVVNYIKSLDNKHINVLIFGHNYAFTSIVNTYGDQYIDNLPTSGVVSIAFDINNWEEIKEGKTIRTLFPKDLK